MEMEDQRGLFVGQSLPSRIGPRWLHLIVIHPHNQMRPKASGRLDPSDLYLFASPGARVRTFLNSNPLLRVAEGGKR